MLPSDEYMGCDVNLGHLPLPGAVDGQFGQEKDDSETGRALGGKRRG